VSPAESAAVNSILASAKYAPVERSVIERVAADAVRRYGPKRAEDEAKRLLHQIWGMYYGGAKLRTPAVGDLEATLRLHQSAKERLPFLRNFYERVFAIIGQPESIADYACGLNPLAYASLGWPFPSRYLASDIDTFTVGILNAGFERLRVEDRFSARLDDLMTGTPKPADVTFLLKVLPVL
jgi:16S rRNA (guanine(1405)-N(7))-methyltransferase